MLRLVFYITLMAFLFLYNDSIAKNLNITDFNVYYDTREEYDGTINLMNQLTNNLQYFSFTNFTSNKSSADQVNFYTEHNLRLKPIQDFPIEITKQLVIASGNKNDKLQYGLRVNFHQIEYLKSIFKAVYFEYNFNPHIFTVSSYSQPQYLSQIEHVFKFNLKDMLYSGDIYISGFADQNISKDKPQTWVVEAQLGLEVMQNFYFVTELRYNDFLTNKSGIGIGLEYKIVSFSFEE